LVAYHLETEVDEGHCGPAVATLETIAGDQLKGGAYGEHNARRRKKGVISAAEAKAVEIG
jgi:hypothetical protein